MYIEVMRITALLLMISLLITTSGNVVITMAFYLNQAYIASEFCVKREIKDNTCQGTCYLTEKFEQNNQNEPTEIPLAVLLDQSIQILAIINTFATLHYSQEDCEYILQDYFHQTNDFVTDVFHPPKG